jgi:hypothetical protein
VFACRGWANHPASADNALRLLGAGLIGAGVAGISATVLARHVQSEKKRRAAFLASFAVPIRPRPLSVALPAI